MLQSPLYIDIKCTTVGSPRAKSLGFRSRLTPRRAAGGFEGCLGHEGCKYGLRNERLSQCEVLRELQVGRETEQRLLQEPGKVEAGAARGVRDARRMDVSLPAQGWRGEMRCPGTCFALHHLVPTWGREHCVLDEIPWGEHGLQLLSRWAHRKMPPWFFFFPPCKGATCRLREGVAQSGAASKFRCRARH